MEQQIIKCAFCGGGGRHPYYFKSLCPVCKGKGENTLNGEFQRCKYCKGSGRKSTTTLTCFYCGGLGVVAGAKIAVGSQHVDKNVIEKVVEVILKKYNIEGLGAVGQETVAIERIPVSGVLRAEKEMKTYMEPISGVRKESAGPINQAVASLKDVKKREQVTGLTKVEQGDFEKTVSLLVKMKKEGDEKRWQIQK